jgi:hypothetical protein
MTEHELEKIIRTLVKRKNALDMDSAEYAFYERQLAAIRYSHEEAGGIIEEADPDGWGCYCRPLEVENHPTSKVLLLRSDRKSVSPSSRGRASRSRPEPSR